MNKTPALQVLSTFIVRNRYGKVVRLYVCEEGHYFVESFDPTGNAYLGLGQINADQANAYMNPSPKR